MDPFSVQNGNPESRYGTSLFLQLYGPEVLGLHLNHDLSEKIALNFGLGVNLDAHFGTNLYFQKRGNRKSSWFAGVQLSLVREFSLVGNLDFLGGTSSGNSNEAKGLEVGVYIPLGYEYIATRGFSLQLDIGPNFIKDEFDQVNTMPFFGSVKVGYTFRRRD